MQYTEIEVARKAVELADANPEFTYKAPLLVADNETYFLADDGSLVDDCGYEVDPEGGECRYVHTEEDGTKVPGCLYGQALHALGMPLAAMASYEENSVSMFWGRHSWDEMSPVLKAIQSSQQNQDRGEAWGEAIEPVKKALAELEGEAA